MNFSDMQRRALALRERCASFEDHTYGRCWSSEEIAMGFVGDVGDLMKLVQAKEGVRTFGNVDDRLGHEFADCLWSMMVLADEYNIDLEKSFETCMTSLENWLNEKGC